MRIGFIGAGSVGRTMGRRFIDAGHDIVLSNARGSESLKSLVADFGPRAEAGAKQDAARCDVVVLCVNWGQAREALAGIDWNGRILVDATNAHVDDPPDISLAGVTRSRAALARTGRTSSEIVAAWAPGAQLVKSISTVPMGWIEDSTGDGLRTVLFTSGDDAEAKRVVIALLDEAGFAPVDLGPLREGGALHEVGGPLSGLHLHLRRRLR